MCWSALVWSVVGLRSARGPALVRCLGAAAAGGWVALSARPAADNASAVFTSAVTAGRPLCLPVHFVGRAGAGSVSRWVRSGYTEAALVIGGWPPAVANQRRPPDAAPDSDYSPARAWDGARGPAARGDEGVNPPEPASTAFEWPVD